MMVTFKELGELGVIKDTEELLLPTGAWSDGNNVAFRDGVVQAIDGESEVYASPTQVPHILLPFPEGSDYYWVYASLAKAYYCNASGHTDITRLTGGDYSGNPDIKWTGCVLHGNAFLNNGVDKPQKWAGVAVGGKCSDLANWIPAGLTSMTTNTLRSFGDFLIALDVTEDATHYPTMVRWSHPMSVGQTEPDTWDEAVSTKLAGKVNLSETSDFVIDCLPLRGMNIIYKQNSTFSQRLIGGNQVFKFEKMFAKHGILARGCVQPWDDTHHLVATIGDIISHDGNTSQSILTRKARDALFDNLDPDSYRRCFMTRNPVHNEMWFFYPSGNTSYCDRVLIWNSDTGSITYRDADDIACAGVGVVDNSAGVSFDADVGTFDGGSSESFGALEYNPTVEKILMGKNDASTPKLLVADDGTSFDGSDITSQVERRDLTIAGQGPNGFIMDDNVDKAIGTMVPIIEGGEVEISIGTKDNIAGSYAWSAKTFTPGVDRKLDFRKEGRYWAVRFRAVGQASWRLKSFSLEIEPTGERNE